MLLRLVGCVRVRVRVEGVVCPPLPYLCPGPVSWCVLAGLGFPLELVCVFFSVPPEALPLKVVVYVDRWASSVGVYCVIHNGLASAGSP